MARLCLLPRRGNAAAVLFGAHGDSTRHTHLCGWSRQTAYDHAHQVPAALADAQPPGPSREHLRDDNQRLRQDNQQLGDWLDQSVECPKAKRRPFAVQAAALGLRLLQTRAWLAILLPAALVPGRTTLGRWVAPEARRARRLLQVRDEAGRRLVVCRCLDEIFFRRQPVLLGVEPFRLAWVVGQRADDRSGPTGAKARAAWPAVEDVAAAGGSGIALGLERAGATRREEAAQKNQRLRLKPRIPRTLERWTFNRQARRLWSPARRRASAWQSRNDSPGRALRPSSPGGDGPGATEL